MEFNFDFRRLLLLTALLGGFALFGGFTKAQPSPNSFHNSVSVQKAWYYCVLLYVAGASLASLTDHWAGTMEPVNYRILYIILGALLMLAGGLWLRSLKETVEKQEEIVFMNLTPAFHPPEI
ncbi:hypothetical protein WJU23_14705 [Prosthecobacter sp. SYSU 5D2]|uniref:hypothetical protein n=1 Tax=Prosthecobacter sp. SYSU 5D2 TaxID=3134134 RepID=UPI0031FF1270